MMGFGTRSSSLQFLAAIDLRIRLVRGRSSIRPSSRPEGHGRHVMPLDGILQCLDRALYFGVIYRLRRHCEDLAAKKLERPGRPTAQSRNSSRYARLGQHVHGADYRPAGETGRGGRRATISSAARWRDRRRIRARTAAPTSADDVSRRRHERPDGEVSFLRLFCLLLTRSSTTGSASVEVSPRLPNRPRRSCRGGAHLARARSAGPARTGSGRARRSG